ncbi:Uncharacterised protein [uncultured archaeon]|nr:Uncharacterised protein [uncultured archaeon]
MGCTESRCISSESANSFLVIQVISPLANEYCLGHCSANTVNLWKTALIEKTGFSEDLLENMWKAEVRKAGDDKGYA